MSESAQRMMARMSDVLDYLCVGPWSDMEFVWVRVNEDETGTRIVRRQAFPLISQAVTGNAYTEDGDINMVLCIDGQYFTFHEELFLLLYLPSDGSLDDTAINITKQKKFRLESLCMVQWIYHNVKGEDATDEIITWATDTAIKYYIGYTAMTVSINNPRDYDSCDHENWDNFIDDIVTNVHEWLSDRIADDTSGMTVDEMRLRLIFDTPTYLKIVDIGAEGFDIVRRLLKDAGIDPPAEFFTMLKRGIRMFGPVS